MVRKKLRNFLQKNWWIVTLLFSSATGIIFSVIGFSKVPHVRDDWYETTRLFLLNVQFEKDWQLDWTLIIGRWFIFLAFILFSFRIFIQIIAPKWWHSTKQYFPCRKRYLFVGASKQAKILAQNLSEQHCRCIFLLPSTKEDDNALFVELSDRGAIVLYVNLEDETMKFPPKIDKFFFLEEDENLNMEMCIRLLKQLRTAHIYVRTESKQFYSHIKQYKNAEIHIFNQSDLTAGLFVKKYPMWDSPNIEIYRKKLLVKGEFNVLFLGFGWQGQELLKKCVCDSQFVGSTFRATVVDKDFETRYGDYPVLFDECIKHYQLQFKSETVGSKAFYEWIDVEIHNFNRIIVALGNDSINIDTAEKITKILHKQGKLATQKLVFARVQQLNSYSDDFIAFGKLTDIYTKEIIVNEVEDEMAKMINYVYCRYDKPVFEEFTETDRENINIKWKEVTLFDKDSSRAVARNIENMMEIAGKDISELNDAELNIIAENEHLRWNAFHFVNGICEWKLNEITEPNAKFRDKNKNLLKHGCLVPFSELDNVSAKVNEIKEQQGKSGKEDYVETDRRIVRHFPLFLKEVEQLKK
jgi:hypothetical protein